MRTVTNVLIAAVALSALALASPAFATHFWTDSFGYLNGDLTAVSGGLWVKHSGDTIPGSDILVISGVANLWEAGQPRDWDDNRSFTARTVTDKTYSCLRFQLPDPLGTPTAGYFAHFKDAGTFNFTARIWVVAKAPTYTLAIMAGSGTPTVTEYWPTALVYGTWYTVMTSYDANTGTAELWIDPVNESSPKITHTDALQKWAIQAYALRQFTGNWQGNVDDVGVGTTFAEACFDIVPTKASTWGNVKSIYR